MKKNQEEGMALRNRLTRHFRKSSHCQSTTTIVSSSSSLPSSTMSRPTTTRRRRQRQPSLLAMLCLVSILFSQKSTVQSFSSSSSSSSSSTTASGIGGSGGVGVGSNHHSHSPIELDVESKPTCDYNSRSGIAGDIGTHYYVVEYHYQMILNTSTIVVNGDNGGSSISFQEPKNWNDIDPNSLQDIVLSIEFEVASFLLKESSVFEDAPCNNGRRRRRSTRRRVQQQQQQTPVDNTVSSIGTTGNGDYSLVNVGMTVGPDDEILGQCSSSGSESELQQQQQDVVICYEVAGYFQVYTVGESTDTTSAQSHVLNELKRAMDNGRLDNSHDAVVSISYVDKNNDTSDTMENTEDNSEEIPKQPNDDSSTTSSSSSGNSQSNNNPFGATSSENSSQSSSSSSTTTTTTLAPSASAAIIVVATVGSVLLVVGVVLLRRRDIVERGNLTSSSSTSVVVATTGNNNINNISSRNLSCRSQNIEDSVITDTSNLHDVV